MATYELKSPDGQTYRVNAPDDATEDQVMEYFQSQLANQSAPSTESAPRNNDVPQEVAAPVAQPQAQGTSLVDDATEAGRGLLQTGVNVLNSPAAIADAFKSAGAWAGNKLGIGDGTYTPTQRIELPDGLRPTNELVKGAAEIAPMFIGGPGSAAAKAGSIAERAAPVIGRTIAGGLANDGSETAGDDSANLATVATMALGNKGNLLRVAAANTGIGAGIEGARELVDGDIDPSKIAQTAGISGLLGAAGKKAVDGVGSIINRNSNRLGAAADAIRDQDVSAIRGINELNTNVAPADRINLTPGQIFRNQDSELARGIGSREMADARDAGSDVAANYRKQGEQAEKITDTLIGNREDSILNRTTAMGNPRDSEEFLADFSGALNQEQRKIATNNYKTALSSVNGALADSGYKGALNAPLAAKQAQSYLKPKTQFGLDATLTPQARKDLQKVASFKAKDFGSFDIMKRDLNARANDAHGRGDYALSNIYKDLSTQLKSDADNHAAQLGQTLGDPNIPGIWKKADAHYSEMMGDFGRGSRGFQMQRGDTDADIVSKYLQGKNGPERISDMREIARKSGDPSAMTNFQDSILSQVLKKARGGEESSFSNTGAIGGRTSDFNFGAMSKELRRNTKHIEAAFKGNTPLIDSYKNMTNAFDILRSNDLARQGRSFVDGTVGKTIKSNAGILSGLLGFSAGGPLGAAAALAPGLIDGVVSNVQRRGATKFGEFALKNLDEIENIKKGLSSNNPALKIDAAQEYMNLLSREYAQPEE